ncbi:suppressor APC domain-containing protein 2 [Spea bombifrons]|uniref:suppressor APC domain-containing protein 2 n=1 Tax=Spea bombifrons TaxID=233779 RepID=UPI00234A34F0|nr:suppressor APC domain-containing protein 2 [Spea bombifrons]
MALIGGRPVIGEPVPSTQGLPRAFLHSLRTLFDILDDRRRGSVHIQEIETRWQGADTRDLPPGVLQCLRQVAPPDGYLTFDRFVHGLRTSMLNSQNRENWQAGVPRGPVKLPGKGYVCKPAPLGVRYMNGTREPTGGYEISTAAYRGEADRNGVQPPPERPRQGGELRPMGRSHSETAGEGMKDQCRHQRSRGEHRRHTITNGVDYSVLKKMKEMEQEKDFLIQGLEMVERARDWYLQQIQMVQEQQRNLSQSHADRLPDGAFGSLNSFLPKLQEVNRCLNDLVCPGKVGVAPPPAAPGPPPPVAPMVKQQAINMLKEQNRLLTKEVSEKSDRITQLEQEKSALIKQLFEARARSHQESGPMDSTFI